jgi:NAD(P)-dependent dehydrogenase (short-subunit alcohol dehydrogenase family)
MLPIVRMAVADMFPFAVSRPKRTIPFARPNADHCPSRLGSFVAPILPIISFLNGAGRSPSLFSLCVVSLIVDRLHSKGLIKRKFLPLEEITEDVFHREFNTNVLGTILATKEAVRHFGPNGGSVINISSIASAGEAQAAIYSGTNGAVDAITRGLAAELGPRKIRVNAIAPGGVETEGTHSAGIMGSDFEKAMIAGTPPGRIGQPDDIARVAVFLASEDSAWLTGERLTASGGYR